MCDRPDIIGLLLLIMSILTYWSGYQQAKQEYTR
jgi:hypothetical protein